MRIIKTSKLPKLKAKKYKCCYCDTIFEVTDKELLRMPKLSSLGVHISCPFCDKSLYMGERGYKSGGTGVAQIERCVKYKDMYIASCKQYGYNWLNQEEYELLDTLLPNWQHDTSKMIKLTEIRNCCVCGKDITELPKIDAQGRYYCLRCYENKCKKDLKDSNSSNKEDE